MHDAGQSFGRTRLERQAAEHVQDCAAFAPAECKPDEVPCKRRYSCDRNRPRNREMTRHHERSDRQKDRYGRNRKPYLLREHDNRHQAIAVCEQKLDGIAHSASLVGCLA